MHPDKLGSRVEVAAFFVAFLGLFALATIPILNLLVAPLVPIPLAAVFLRHGTSTGVVCIATAVLLLMVCAVSPVQLYSLPFLCSAVVLGFLGRKGLGAVQTIVTGSLALTLLASSLFYGYDLYAYTTHKMPSTASVIDGLYNPDRIMENLAKPPDTPAAEALDDLFFWMTGEHVSGAALKAQSSQEYSDWLKHNEETREFLLKVDRFPVALFFLTAISYFGVFYVLARWTLARRGIVLAGFEGFRSWRLPWYFAWGPIACFAAHALCRLLGLEMGEFAFDSLVMVTLVPYMAIAFSIAAYCVEKARMDPLMAAVFYSFLILYLKPIAVLAIFDSWLDFRKLEKREEPPPDDSSHDGWDDDIDF